MQYWHSAEAPADVAELVATFRDQNPDLRHQLFSEATAEAFIDEHLGPRELAAFRACAVPAMQADYFRCCALHVLGGLYVDVDYRCLAPLSPLIEATDGGMMLDSSSSPVNNSILLFRKPDHPLLKLAIDVATINIERRFPASVHVVTGPWIFVCLLELHRLGSFAAGRDSVRTLKGRPGIPARALRSLADVLIETIGDFERLEEAWKDVVIAPIESVDRWIREPSTPPAYKRDGTHWIEWQRRGEKIFR